MNNEVGAISLYKALVKNHSLQDIVDQARDLLGNPLFVGDVDLNVLASSFELEKVSDTLWQKIVSDSLEVKYQELLAMGEKSVTNDFFDNSNKVVILDNDYFEHRWLYGPIFINGVYVAAVSVLEIDQDISDKDFEIVQCLVDIITYLFNQKKTPHDSQFITREYYMTQLLSGEDIAISSLKAQMTYVDWSKKVFHFVAIIAPKNPSDTFNMQPLKKWLSQNMYGTMVTMVKNQIVLFISRNQKNDQKLNLLTQEIVDRISNALCQVFISRSFQSFEDFGDNYQQALRLMALSRTLNHSSNITYFDDLFEENLAVSILNNTVGLEYMHEKMLEIREYDAINNTDYLYDLYIYLSTGRSGTSSSEILGIHRNTVNYRINKICDLFSLDLNDPEIVFEYTLSLKLYYFQMIKTGED